MSVAHYVCNCPYAVCSFGERARQIKNKVSLNQDLGIGELRALLAKAQVCVHRPTRGTVFGVKA